MLQVKITSIEDKKINVQADGNAITCIPWELTKLFHGIDELTVKPTLHFMSSMEAEASLLNWFDCLAIGGRIELEVPDFDYAISLWQSASWDEKSIKNSGSAAREAFALIFGGQIGLNPKLDDYKPNSSSIHLSGYNKKRLEFLLYRVGFTDVDIRCVNGLLVAIALKTMHKGERQIANNYEQIRQDHKNRYQFACDKLLELDCGVVLDLACGIGYGSLMIAEKTQHKVIGVDVDSGAIDYAQRFFKNNNVDFLQQDALALKLEKPVDAIVSFETIEHVPFYSELLDKFYNLLKPNGLLICSTPNQTLMPFDAAVYKFHIRHFTNSEMEELLVKAGFKIIDIFMQSDKINGIVEPGDCGCFSIFVCEKVC